MKKSVLKITIIFLTIILINLGLTTISNAALSISVSKTTVSPGESFSVTVSVSSNEAGHITLSASNATLSNTNIDLMSSSSATVTCTAGSSGTITINASGTVANYDTETEGSQTASPRTVSIVVPQSQETTPQPENPTPTQTKSSNANLSNLGINPYDFRGFKAANTSYSVSVPNSVSAISIYATAQHSKAKISGTGSKSLKVGKNTFNVVVTAEDGTTKTYTLYITRQNEETETKPTEQPETPVKSSDVLLGGLVIEEGVITPEFDANIKEYTINVPEDTPDIHINATPANEKATIVIEGGTDLQLGENIVTIKVVAEDGTEGIYTIKVIKKNNKIALKNLIIGYLNENGNIVELPISPEFDEDILEYTIDGIDYSIDKLQINAIPFSEDLSVEIKGNDDLQEGRNVITILVRRVLETGEIQEVEYKLIANKKIAPKVGLMGKIKNSFTGFIGSIKNYVNENRESIIVCALGFCAGAMFILSIYIIIDYRKYKMLLAKIKTLVNENSRVKDNNTQDNKIEENIVN